MFMSSPTQARELEDVTADYVRSFVLFSDWGLVAARMQFAGNQGRHFLASCYHASIASVLYGCNVLLPAMTDPLQG